MSTSLNRAVILLTAEQLERQKNKVEPAMHAGIICAGRKTGELGGLCGSSVLGNFKNGRWWPKNGRSWIRDLAVVEPHSPLL